MVQNKLKQQSFTWENSPVRIRCPKWRTDMVYKENETDKEGKREKERVCTPSSLSDTDLLMIACLTAKSSPFANP